MQNVGMQNPNGWGQGVPPLACDGWANPYRNAQASAGQYNPNQGCGQAQAQTGQFSAQPARDRDLGMLLAIAKNQRDMEARLTKPAASKDWLGMGAALAVGVASGIVLARLATTVEVRRRSMI